MTESSTAVEPRKKARKGPKIPPELAGKLHTIAEVCERLAVSRWTVYRYIDDGVLAEGEQIGPYRTITKKSVDDYIRRLARGA